MSNLQPVEQQQQQPVTIEYVPSVAITLEQMADNLKKLDAIRTKIMRKGVDYDTIPGTPKPTLLKPGAERLLQFFGLGHRVQCVHKIEDWDNGFFYYVYRATIIKQYPTHTIVVAECEGSANSKEKRYRNQDVFSIVNTLQKMAIKRALVGATLQATGTSGFFTQDVEDLDIGPETAPQSPEQRSNGRRGGGTMRDPDGPATEQQMKAVHAIANRVGLTDDELKGLLESQFGVSSTKELTKQQASSLIDLLQKTPADQLRQLAGTAPANNQADDLFGSEPVNIADDDLPFE